MNFLPLRSPGGGAIEHAAHRHAINACGGDAKSDDATSEDVHDQHHPMAAQKDGYNAEEIDTPDAVLRVSDECQPGRTIGTRLGSKMFGKHPPHDIFLHLHANRVSALL